MSFIPSKLGLRTHPLTQINLALVRVAGEKIYAQFAALLSDPNYGPSPRAGRLNNKRCVVLLHSEYSSKLFPELHIWLKTTWRWCLGSQLGGFLSRGSPLTPAGLHTDHQHPPITGLDRKLCVCSPDHRLLYFIIRRGLCGCFNGQVSDTQSKAAGICR